MTTYSVYTPVAGQAFECQSGNSYTANGAGLITGVLLNDLGDLIRAGCTVTGGTASAIVNNLTATTNPTANEDTGDGYSVGSVWVNITQKRAYVCVDATLTAAVWALTGTGGNSTSNISATTSFVSTVLPITGFKNSAGTTIAASAASGVFGISQTLGTSALLTGESANSTGPLTDTAVYEFIMPRTYVAATDFNVVINANTNGAGTFSTKTVAAGAYKLANAGTEGATLIATAAQAVTGTAADYTFVVTGATLSPGDRVMFSVVSVLTETGGVASTIKINSVRLT